MVLGKTFHVSQKSQPKSVLLESKNIQDALLFESGAVAVLSPEEKEQVRKRYNKPFDAHACLGVLDVNLGDGHALYLVMVTACSSIGRLHGAEILRIIDVHMVPLLAGSDQEDVAEVRKLLCSGTFYFSSNSTGSDGGSRQFEGTCDLSLSAQCQFQRHIRDDRFFWNKRLHDLPLQYGVDTSAWLVRILCGGVEVRTVYAGGKQAKMMLISRLSCQRAGTRFNVRGVDDYGEVANFVETEQVIYLDEKVVSFVQLRGSVPLFWEQPGFQTGAHRVKMSRGYEACTSAFRRHVNSLRSRYGPQLFVSLLNWKESEALLSTAFQDQVKDYGLSKSELDIIVFDYHQQCRGGSHEKLASVLLQQARSHMDKHKFFHAVGDQIQQLQEGSMRTNCMDCLDRTNAVQTFFGLEVLKEQMGVLGFAEKSSVFSRFQEALRELWRLNGDHVSRIYAGSGALEGKAKVGGKLRDGARSVARTLRNNFLDGSKQEAIDMLLTGNAFAGKLGARARQLLSRQDAVASPILMAEMCDRHKEFVEGAGLRVSVGTWNVNGGKHFRSIAFKNQSMHDWLLDARRLDPRPEPRHIPVYTAPRHRRQAQVLISDIDDDMPPLLDDDHPVDIFAVGFEELVDLSATNIVSTSSQNKKEWGGELQRVLSRDNDYVLLTCEQLVGVCLYVFVRPGLIPHIRDVAVDSVKTGMHGKAGNKGGVAIRFIIYGTSLCFVCAHLAAGQSHVLERNSDFAEILRKISFPLSRTVNSHDYVFWCGDFNYRIDMPIDEVKQAISDGAFDKLVKADQLRNQMKDAKVFPGFSEGSLDFAPTYKYDLFSEDYDTSEKLRTPAWTDRVLWHYNRQPSYIDMIGRLQQTAREESDGASASYDSVPLLSESGDGEGEDGKSVSLSLSSAASSQSAYAECNHSNHGRLVYYGRADLRTSDHRPVLGIIDIEVEKVRLSARDAVRDKVLRTLGPADPTIIVTYADLSAGGSVEDEMDVDNLLDVVEQFGLVVLIRFVESNAFITFSDSRSALKALELDGAYISGRPVSVSLRAPWSPEAPQADIFGSLSDVTAAQLPAPCVPFATDSSQENLLPSSLPISGLSPAVSPNISPSLQRKADSGMATKPRAASLFVLMTDDMDNHRQKSSLYSQPDTNAVSATDEVRENKPVRPAPPSRPTARPDDKQAAKPSRPSVAPGRPAPPAKVSSSTTKSAPPSRPAQPVRPALPPRLAPAVQKGRSSSFTVGQGPTSLVKSSSTSEQSISSPYNVSHTSVGKDGLITSSDTVNEAVSRLAKEVAHSKTPARPPARPQTRPPKLQPTMATEENAVDNSTPDAAEETSCAANVSKTMVHTVEYSCNEEEQLRDGDGECACDVHVDGQPAGELAQEDVALPEPTGQNPPVTVPPRPGRPQPSAAKQAVESTGAAPKRPSRPVRPTQLHSAKT